MVPGFRYRSSGMLSDVGYHGYSWASSVAGTNAHGLDFYFNGINPQHSHYHAFGLPLRCLQE